MINEKEYAKVIAVNLRNIMYERHLTQADLARDLNINKATISSWMNATKTPNTAFYGVSQCRQRGSNPH